MCSVAIPLAAAVTPVPDKIAAVIPDRQDSQVPDRVQLTGWVGARIDANEQNRLVKLDPARLLEGFRQRPGRQAWDGEHVGKWLHAATLAWVNTGDPALRKKLDLVAAGLCRCQLDDGYLGTYLEKDRWTEWDVWVHKYNLIGLTTYMRYTGDLAPLATCRRMADLLCRTFGDGPGQRDIIKAGWHAGMAPTSVLEPMVLLYRFTGEPRYLEFCRYLLRAWEQPDGPHIISTLLSARRVDQVGNGKAYEMLSCLNGALELYRLTGDRPLIEACLNAWQDIVEKRLFLTGAASYRERFHDDFDLPNIDDVGETCVAVTWLQFNAQLLRLTGEARFAEQLERVVLNQLFGAQRPDGTAWGYFVQMEGQKPYAAFLDVTCCQSSGPRGVALIPTFALTTDAGGVVVNFFAAAKAQLTLRDGGNVPLELESQYPADGLVRLKLHPAAPHEFTVSLRIPAWCSDATLAVNDQAVTDPVRAGDYARLRREWREGDVVTLRLPLTPRLIVGEHGNEGKVAFACGPLILAADDRLNPGVKVGQFRIPSLDIHRLAFKQEPSGLVYSIQAVDIDSGEGVTVRLAPFAEAGCTRMTYQVWLPGPPQPASG